MANPFDSTNQPGNGIFNNLMNFGLATMAAANERDGNGLLKYGGGPAGAIGAGGVSAMNTARENALAKSQIQDVQSQAQGRILDNRLKLANYNMMAPFYGMQPLNTDGSEQQPLGNLQASGSSNGGQVTPPTNTNGMTASPTAGNSPLQPQYRDGAATPSGPVTDQARLRDIIFGAAPETDREAAEAGIMAAGLGPKFEERAKTLQQRAMAGSIKRAEYFSTPQSYSPEQTVIDPQTGQPIVGRTATGQPYYSGGNKGSGAAPEGGSQQVPLGIRNNNPLNLRPSGDNWQGMTGQSQGYLTFDNPESGVRAASKNLLTYNQRGINTPESIVNAWAPAGDNNNPKAYAEKVATMLGVKPDQPIDLTDPYMNGATIRAMSYVENGGHYLPNGVIAAGVQSAFGMTPPGSTASASPMPARQASFVQPAGGMQASPGVYQAPMQGGAPAAPSAVSDLPPGAVPLGPNPLRQKDFEQQITNFNSDMENKKYASAAALKQNMVGIFDDLKVLNESPDKFLTTGEAFEKRKNYANALNTMNSMMGGPGNLIDPEKVASAEDLMKQNARGGMQAINEMFGASREAASVISTGIKSFPGGDLSPKGNMLLSHVILEGANRVSDLHEYKQQALESGQYDLRKAEIDFNKQFPPESYARRAISQMTPVTVNKPGGVQKLLPGTLFVTPQMPKNANPKMIPYPNSEQP